MQKENEKGYYLAPGHLGSPSEGHQTMYIVGRVDVDEVFEEAAALGVTHVHLAANQSWTYYPLDAWMFRADRLARRLQVSLDVPYPYLPYLHKHHHNKAIHIVISVRAYSLEGVSFSVRLDDYVTNPLNKGTWQLSPKGAYIPHITT